MTSSAAKKMKTYFRSAATGHFNLMNLPPGVTSPTSNPTTAGGRQTAIQPPLGTELRLIGVKGLGEVTRCRELVTNGRHTAAYIGAFNRSLAQDSTKNKRYIRNARDEKGQFSSRFGLKSIRRQSLVDSPFATASSIPNAH